jgi:hypothetical protein
MNLTCPLQPECQKFDWRRHKKDPCAPVEDIIASDDLWGPSGYRDGTTFFLNTRDKMLCDLFAGDGSLKVTEFVP